VIPTPQKFKDTQGKEWVIEINAGTFRHVKREIGVDLADCLALENNLIDRMGLDLCLLIDLIQTICQSQWEAQGLNGEEFVSRLNGEAIDTAGDGIIQALIDFFPPSRSGPLRKVATVRKRVKERATAKADQLLESLTDEKIDQAVDTILNGSGALSSNSPDSSG